MSQETVQHTPALTASQNSWRCVQAKDKEGWLALMAEDVVIEDPIGPAYTNPDGIGVRGKEGVSSFWDNSIGLTTIKITCEETFPSSSPDEIAHILSLRFTFERLSKRGARHLHAQGQRRRPANQPARLLEHGHDEARSGGQDRLASRWADAARSSSEDLAASGWRWPNYWPPRAQASSSTDVTPMQLRPRRSESRVSRTQARRPIHPSPML
jgi:steroid Delta-isomerase